MTLTLREAFLTLASDNFEALVQFYRQLLNQDPILYLPNVYAEFHLPTLKLGIFRPKTPTYPLPPTSCRMRLCLEVENLESAIAHLTHLGCPPPGEILTASHGREIYAYDPDGNGLILHQAHPLNRDGAVAS